nr:sortase [Candidatus Gracilibacteria bacterium]
MDNNFDILKEISQDNSLDFQAETEIKIEKETIYNNFSSTNEIQEETNILNTLFIDENSELESNEKLSLKSILIFILKYISTSTIIFFLLLITTNYKAYINIADSYINEGQMKQTENSLINSVEATNITSSNDINIEKKPVKKDETLNNISNSFRTYTNIKNEDPSLDISITPYENRIIIPKIGKNIPLIDIKNRTVSGQSELNNIFMQELENGVIRYPGSAKPGDIGNAFIFGHSSNFPWIKGEYNDVFALLDKVSYDDEVIIYYNQKKYTYKIRNKTVISPGNVSILKGNKTKSEVSIMTCRPIGTTLNRLVVSGELVEEKDSITTKEVATINQ